MVGSPPSGCHPPTPAELEDLQKLAGDLVSTQTALRKKVVTGIAVLAVILATSGVFHWTTRVEEPEPEPELKLSRAGKAADGQHSDLETKQDIPGFIRIDHAGYGEQSAVHDKHGSDFRALVYTPVDFRKKTLMPLLIFLHGAGESGTDLDDLLSEGATGCPAVQLHQQVAPKALRDDFIVASPQTNSGWSNVGRITTFLDFLLMQYNIDPARVYVSGVSMGGYGALVSCATGRFAACVPICAAGSVDPEKLIHTPIWVWHGSNDAVVPVDLSDELVKRLQELGGKVKYSRPENAPTPPGWPDSIGHASWQLAFKDDAVFKWLLEHHKPPEH